MRYLLIILLFLSSPLLAQDNQLVKLYNKDSTVVSTGVVSNQQRQGLWKYFDAKTNKLITEGNFEDNVQDGKWTTYHPDGKKRMELEYKNGKLFGPAKIYDADGYLKRDLTFQDSVLIGNFVEYYGKTGQPSYIEPKRVLTEGQYDKGKKIGQCITYHPFGEVYIREFYENGLRQGPYLSMTKKAT